MKIAVISPNKLHLQEVGKVLQGGLQTALLIEGGKSKMREIVERENPDLLLVDGMCSDPGELAHVEHVTMHYPATAVVLMCSNATPDFLINSMRAGVREVLPSPVTPQALEAAINRIASKMRGIQARPTGKVIAFIPTKGGSGATFLATNLGSYLAESKSVLLIDLNLQFGDALSFVYDGKAASTLADTAREIGRLDASFLAASAVRVTPQFNILAAPDDPAQSMEVKPEHVEAILALAVQHYDFVILDMGRPIDTIGVKSLDRADIIFPVLQAGLPSIRATKKMLTIFKSLGYSAEKIELIVNRFERNCDIGLSEIERALGRITIHTVPNSYKHVNSAINHGDTVIATARNSPVSRSLAEFARTINPLPEEGRKLFDRLLSRVSA